MQKIVKKPFNSLSNEEKDYFVKVKKQEKIDSKIGFIAGVGLLATGSVCLLFSALALIKGKK